MRDAPFRRRSIVATRLASHRARNWIHSALLVAGVLAIVVAAAAMLFGAAGVPWLLGVALLGWWMTPQLSHWRLLRAMGARPLSEVEAPALFRALRLLSRRAELYATPALFYLPDARPNAFTLGQRDGAAIVLSDGLLRMMQLDELAAILAHEVAHIRHADLRVMSIVDAIARTSESLGFVALLLMVLNVPLALTGQEVVPWPGLLLLLAAPTLCAVLQLALSRTREYAADIEAVRLFGDTRALIRALRKLEAIHRGLLSRIFGPRRYGGESSLLRTHPATMERIARLEELTERDPAHDVVESSELGLADDALPDLRRRR